MESLTCPKFGIFFSILGGGLQLANLYDIGKNEQRL